MNRKTIPIALADCCRQPAGTTQRSSLLPRRLQAIRPRCFTSQQFSYDLPAVQHFRRIAFSSPFSTIAVDSNYRAAGICIASSETTYRVDVLRSPMATARKIELSTSDSGVYSTGVKEDAARAASEVLQENLEKHHIYFNDSGFHSMFHDLMPRIYS